ncbi:MAG: signal transduction histidine kinase [Verrucomicrobiales bacterium]|jgi:signal transduction histidine kinase
MDIANDQLSEMHSLVGRIRLACAAVKAFRVNLEDQDKEMLDYMVDASEALNRKFTSILTEDTIVDPTYELSREERHDLRNNITAVLGFGELLLQCYAEPTVMIQQLDRLRMDSKRFTELTMPSEMVSA